MLTAKKQQLASYQGQFGANWFQGKGVYTDRTGCIYDGEWDEQLRVGYGKFTDKSGTSRYTGWKSVGDSVTVDGHWGIWDPELSEKDWARIMDGSIEQNFTAEQYLIAEDELDAAECIIRTRTGDIEVYKAVPGTSDKRLLFTTNQAGILFGWASLLKGVGVASADIIAKSDVTVDVILNTKLWELFNQDPGLFFRFFRHMALNQEKLFAIMFQNPNEAKYTTADYIAMWDDRYGSNTSLIGNWPEEDRDGELEMRQCDWDIIHARSSLVTIGHGDYLFEEGKQRDIKLYQIVDGTVNVIRTVGGVPTIVATHGPGDIVGENSFIRHFNSGETVAVASAGLQVSSEKIVTAVIDAQWLRFLFVHRSDLGGRFFAYLCTILAKRVDVQNMLKLKVTSN